MRKGNSNLSIVDKALLHLTSCRDNIKISRLSPIMNTWIVYSSTAGSNATHLVGTRSTFGPAAPGRFDFTLLFQDTILSIVPSAMLLLFVPPRIWMLFKQRVKVAKSPLHESKMVNSSIMHSLLPKLTTA